MRFRLRTLLIVAALLPAFLGYVGTYAVLSRRGYTEGDKYGVKGFYFVVPGTVPDWKSRNRRLNLFYYPLIQLEIFLGTGRLVAGEPLEGLSE